MQTRQFLTASLLCLFVCGIAGICSADMPSWLKFGKGDSRSIVWMHDLKAAHQVAVRENKPLLITFGASWCTYCKKMDETTLAEGKMVEFVQENFVPVHLDFDKNRETAKILEVETLPTMVVLSPEADLLGRIIGFKKSEDLRDELKAAQQNGALAKR